VRQSNFPSSTIIPRRSAGGFLFCILYRTKLFWTLKNADFRLLKRKNLRFLRSLPALAGGAGQRPISKMYGREILH
jgi:hypothetical protein